MKVEEIKDKAKTMGIKPGKMKKVDLVRAIQHAEGNTECYNSGNVATCGQDQCLWREDC
jgi:hypothetical protein